MQDQVTLSWTPDPTPTVTGQRLLVSVGGVDRPPENLPPSASSFTLVVGSADHVTASLWSTDGVTNSPPCSFDSPGTPEPTPLPGPTGPSVTRVPYTPSGSLVHARDVQYLGAFRVPGSAGLDFVQGTMAYNPNNNSLFIVGYDPDQRVNEISIVAPTLGSDINSFNTCTVLQGQVDVLGRIPNNTLAGRQIQIGGLLVLPGNTLVCTAYDYYDGNQTAVGSHFTLDSLNLTTANVNGLYSVGAFNPGIVAGYMVPVPAALRASVGWPYITGQSGLAIIGRTSSGPCVCGFDPADFSPSTLAGVGHTPAGLYLYYPDTFPLGTYQGPAEPLWGGNALTHSMVFVANSRTVLFIGLAPMNYKGYGEPVDFNDDTDPANKGPHSMNGEYALQMWAYDVNDFILAKNGTIQSYEVLPYAAWNFTLPYEATVPRYPAGAAYDPATGKIYVCIRGADHVETFSSRPLIAVFQVPTVSTVPGNPEVGWLAVTDTVTHTPDPQSGTIPFCNPIPVGDPVYLTAGNVYPVTVGATIVNVAFYLGATFLGNGTPNAGNASHNWVLNPVSTVGFTTGSHAISAVATDSGGRVSSACAGAIVVT